MAKRAGKDFRVMVEAALGVDPPAWHAVVGARTDLGRVSTELVDTTDKDGVPWRGATPCGVRSAEMTVSGFVRTDPNSDLFNWLMARVFDGVAFNGKIQSSGTDWISGTFAVISVERSGEYNGAEQYTVTFSSAALVYIPSVVPWSPVLDLTFFGWTPDIANPSFYSTGSIDDAEEDTIRMSLEADGGDSWQVKVYDADNVLVHDSGAMPALGVGLFENLGTQAPNLLDGNENKWSGGASIPAGRLRFTYVEKAWAPNGVAYPPPPRPFCVMNPGYPAGTITPPDGPYFRHSGGVEDMSPGSTDVFDTEAEAEAGSAGRSLEVWHTGGTVGVFLKDTVGYGDNEGNPPIHRLERAYNSWSYVLGSVGVVYRVEVTASKVGELDRTWTNYVVRPYPLEGSTGNAKMNDETTKNADAVWSPDAFGGVVELTSNALNKQGSAFWTGSRISTAHPFVIEWEFGAGLEAYPPPEIQLGLGMACILTDGSDDSFLGDRFQALIGGPALPPRIGILSTGPFHSSYSGDDYKAVWADVDPAGNVDWPNPSKEINISWSRFGIGSWGWDPATGLLRVMYRGSWGQSPSAATKEYSIDLPALLGPWVRLGWVAATDNTYDTFRGRHVVRVAKIHANLEGY